MNTHKNEPPSGLPLASCSAFWSCVAGSVAIIVETLPLCGSSSLVHESKSMREALWRLVGIMERGEAMEIRKAETLDELEARRITEHVCAMHRDMTGKCFVCGSSSLPPNVKGVAPATESSKCKGMNSVR